MDINDRKTSAMIHAACLMGVTCGGGNARQRAAAAQYAKALGLAFQIRDDMLDVISTEAELGKPIGSDAREGKNTFMALYGLERCGAYVHELSGASGSSRGRCVCGQRIFAAARPLAGRSEKLNP